MPRPADAEGVVWRFGRPAHLDGVFVDRILIGFSVALLVEYVPSQSLEERIDEFPARLRLVVLPRTVGSSMLVEALHKLADQVGTGHRDFSNSAICWRTQSALGDSIAVKIFNAC